MLRARSGNADLAQRALRQTLVMAELGPRIAAVSRLEQATARSTAGQAPRHPPRLPDRRVQHTWVVWIHAQIVRAGVLTPEQHVLPGLAAIARPIDTALGIGPVGVAERGHIQRVGIGWVDADLADVTGRLEAKVLPRLAGIGRAIHAVAVGDVGTDAAFAHADVQHVRVGRRNGDRADRGALEEAIRNVRPVNAPVGGLPHAATGRSEVKRARFQPVGGDRADTPTAERSQQAPLDGAQHISHRRFMVLVSPL